MGKYYGVGIQDVDEVVEGTAFYKRWNSMLERSYCPKKHLANPAYRNCSVHESWHRFSIFREWMSKQDWQGKQLDKDILVPGNKIYSPDTCIFVSQQINKLLTQSNVGKGGMPAGVTRRGSRYEARCNFYGRQKYLGRRDTAQAAHELHLIHRSEYIKEVALNEKDEKLSKALLRISLEILK